MVVKKLRQIKVVLIGSIIIAIGGNVTYMAAQKADTVVLIILGRALAGFGAGERIKLNLLICYNWQTTLWPFYPFCIPSLHVIKLSEGCVSNFGYLNTSESLKKKVFFFCEGRLISNVGILGGKF